MPIFPVLKVAFFGKKWTVDEYHLKDHLGNVRITFSDKNNDGIIQFDDNNDLINEIISEKHYYSFGMEMKGPWYTSPSPTKYTYNGKEFNDDFGLDWLDYGVRQRDPASVIWNQVDPLAEKYPGMSPYNYVANNPLINIDIRGDSITPIGQGQHLQMGMIDWDKGIKGGNGYTLYGGTGTNQSGDEVQMWVASTKGSGGGDYVMDIWDVQRFRSNSGMYKGLANIRDSYAPYAGVSIWEGYKSSWTPENILFGATLLGGAFLSGATRESSKSAYKHGYKYDRRVRERGLEDPRSHNFPYSFDDEILSTKPILRHNGYQKYLLKGNMNKKDGVFEIGVTKDGIIDHRFFRSK